MAVGTFLLILLAVAVGVVIFSVVAGNRSSLDRDERRELQSLRRLVKQLNADAHKYQELEPNFTTVVIDEISNHYQKELNS